MPVRVRAIHTNFGHWGEHAGYHRFVRYLDPAACAVTMAPVPDGNAGVSIPWLEWKLPVRSPRIAEGRMPWYRLGDLAAELRALPSCLMNATEVVHYLSGEHTAQYFPRAIKRSRISRVKTVASFHQPPGLLDTLIRRDVVADVDLVMLVSPTQEAFFRQFLPQERVRTMLHGVDTDFFRPAARVPGGTFKCITVGHWLRDWEAIRTVVQSLSSEPAIEFHVVTERTTGLEGMANVRFHRGVDDVTLRRLYQESDVLFLPLTDSTANNSLLEGLACGLAVISTRLPSVVAYTGEAAALLAARHDADALAEALVHLARQPDERARMAVHARARAEELNWARMAPQWERLYRDLAGATA